MVTTNPNTIRLDDEQRASLARIADKNGNPGVKCLVRRSLRMSNEPS